MNVVSASPKDSDGLLATKLQNLHLISHIGVCYMKMGK
jgi:hypothetical protein